MRYHIMAPNIELSDQMQANLMGKLQKIERFVQRFPPDTVDVDVTVDRHQRTQDFVVSLRLGLTGTVLVAKEQAPGLEQAAIAAVDDVLDQLKRYKAKLRGEGAIAHSRQPVSPEAMVDIIEPLLEQRELYDRAIAGDTGAFEQLMNEEGFSVRRVLRQELQRHGIHDGPEQDALFEMLLGDALAEAQSDLARKPSRMSVPGWLSLKARKAVENHFKRPESGGLEGVA